jgi:predicted RNA-binding protein with PIN domain
MSHLIDGHNLIGSRALAGVTLGDPNDEAHLVALLRSFAARPGAPPMTVFFDAGPSGGNVGMGVTPRALGSTRTVEVRFSAPGEQADDAIIGFLARQKQPGQFTVVTDDGELRQRALLSGANVVTAQHFAAQMQGQPRTRRRRRPPEPQNEPDRPALSVADPAFADIRAAFLEAEKARLAAPLRQDALASQIERLLRGDARAAQEAADWLSQSGQGAAIEPLRAALAHDDAGVRAAAALALGKLSGRVAQEDLANRLIEDSSTMVREAAAQALGRIGNPAAIAPLERAAQSDRKTRVRRAAQEALAQIRARKKAA